MKFSLIFLLIFLLTSSESKEKIIGDTESYNLKVIIDIDAKKKTDEINFHHVVKEKIYFRNKTQILKTEIVDLKNLDGYILSGINELKFKKNNIYQLEHYRSNGSPEIFVYFNVSGIMLYKETAYRNKTECNFIKKGYSKTYFDNFKVVKNYDLMELF